LRRRETRPAADPGVCYREGALPIDDHGALTQGGFPNAVTIVAHTETRPYMVPMLLDRALRKSQYASRIP
jgi:hypothetical protein